MLHFLISPPFISREQSGFTVYTTAAELFLTSSSVSEKMLVEEMLLKILEDLLKEDFQTFKWYLTLDLLENCNPIPRAHLQDASRIEAVDKLLRSYSKETAVKITNEALRRMKMTKASEELMSLYTAGETDRKTTHRSVSDSVF